MHITWNDKGERLVDGKPESELATQIVMTEAQQELLAEVKVQYERDQEYYRRDGGKPETRKGNLLCHLPYEMVREAFKGEPPTK